MNNEYFNLLKTWCDRLMELQITEKKDPEFFGGILCPACGILHGRMDNAIYPMLALADYTGDSRYIEGAKLLFDWTEHNMLRQDGSYFNDKNHSWRGITVFSAQGLAEALIHHGHLLDSQTRQKWEKRLARQAEFIDQIFIRDFKPVVNYLMGIASALALCGKTLNKQEYIDHAKDYAQQLYEYITPDNLIFGEGRPVHAISPKGCRVIDIGYNVEESLPALVTYAYIVDDQPMKIKLKELLLTHLEFMLPDGGWDNSFGSRSAKWTYWGSRTSDGCQIAFCRMAEFNPVFAEAAHRNFLLYKRCTHNGLLYGGPMYFESGQPPCVHHTICHAKALAHMVDSKFEYKEPVILPRDKEKEIRYFPSLHVALLSKGDWRATVSDYDFRSANMDLFSAGGSLTLLWHKKAGPVLAASMPEYYLTEPNNMQFPRYYDCLCQTPRIEYTEKGARYTNLYDLDTALTFQDGETQIAMISGKLKSKLGAFDYQYSAVYTIENDQLSITIQTDAPKAVFHLPIISSAHEKVEQIGFMARITGLLRQINLKSTNKIGTLETGAPRNFNPVGGFQTIPFYIKLIPNEKNVITLTIQERLKN